MKVLHPVIKMESKETVLPNKEGLAQYSAYWLPYGDPRFKFGPTALSFFSS